MRLFKGLIVSTGLVLLVTSTVAISNSHMMNGNNGHMMNGSNGHMMNGNNIGFNQEDIYFTQMMIPHHQQALEMSEIILSAKNIDPVVVKLATEIKNAQQGEITLLGSWLSAWGVDNSVMNMQNMPGMLSDVQIQQLSSSSGSSASKLFLEQMIDHHLGAVQMAEQVLASGKNQAVRALAQEILAAQSGEIELMKKIQSNI